MKRKTLDKIAIGIFLFLIIGSLIITLMISSNQGKNKQSRLSWYRSTDLPEDCRLPGYENDLEEWRKNLRHDQETWYCLKYYE